MFSKSLTARRTPALLCCGILVSVLASCRNKTPQTDEPIIVVAAELLKNGLADNPSTMLADQASSPIHWQPFNRTTMARAEQANRLVFGVVALPQQADYLTVLKVIEEEPAMVHQINEQFVPVLIDADACRETGLLSSVLCNEINRPLSLPLFVWLTPQGNPIAWIPVSPDAKAVQGLFKNSGTVVAQMWRENPAYVTNNSTTDNAARRSRLETMAKCPPGSKQPAVDAAQGTRQLASLYDRGSRTFDGCGSLFPSGSIDLLASSTLVPGLTADAASLRRAITFELSEDLVSSTMIDPLDGGIFHSRIGRGWTLPRFSMDCQSQARASMALITAYRATGKRVLLDRALAAIGYAEKHFATKGGVFSLGRPGRASPELWLWSMEDLEKALSADELKVMTAVSELKGLGNIPAESDPEREYFRRNCLAIRHAPEDIAATSGFTPVQAGDLFESARKKLLKIRQERLGSIADDPRPHAGSSFRMISLYAAAYAATGEPAWRKKAIETLQIARETFSRGPSLQNYPGLTDMDNGGRAFLYGLALQAALDVADITLDPNLISWSEDLASTAGERFMIGDSLYETAKGQSLIDLPLTDRSMLFDDSTVGLLATAHVRLAQLGRSTPKVFSLAVSPFPAAISAQPILHTDQLTAALIQDCGPVVILSLSASPELKEAVSRLPLRVVSRRMAVESDAVSALSVKIVFKDGRTMTVSDGTALQTALTSAPPGN